MPKQPAFAKCLSSAAGIIHVRHDLDRQRTLYSLSHLDWNTVCPSDPDHDWRCCRSKLVVIHGRQENDNLARQILRDGAIEVWMNDRDGETQRVVGGG